ncbi:hypothetical protein CQW23_01967 [Capsicum baccatum]|uniref:MULE transposase domain-containing protein n=1 Tax=Capsicum baccatum TaxID=33114 RepID=A0A2G2XQ41_CAPBA|nr:hypothetical protein CQW23_01967 [Capsicum baccatum]
MLNKGSSLCKVSRNDKNDSRTVGLIVGNYVDTKRIYTPNDIVSDMMREHGISLDYHQAWHAKTKAVNMLCSDPTESYQRILGYLYMLEKHYPGSVISWEKIKENRFLYAFVALDASIHGWEYCRPIVVVDEATLKSLYGGTMLTARTLDPGVKAYLFFLKIDMEIILES